MVPRRRWVAVLLILAIAAPSQAQSQPPLPKQMGAINDYAATLGKDHRDTLQRALDGLKTADGIDVSVLFSLLDPFSDPNQYASAIWSHWNLGTSKSVLLVFVHEGTSWSFAWTASSDLTSQLGSLFGSSAGDPIRSQAKRNLIADAAVTAVSLLTSTFGAPPPAPSTAPNSSSGSNAQTPAPSPSSSVGKSQSFLGSREFWILAGVLFFLIAVAIAIYFALTWLCPRCGSLLSRQRERSFGYRYAQPSRNRSGTTVYFRCPNCGYRRRPHGEGARAARRRRP